MSGTLEVNGVKAKVLIDSGSSNDFIGTHFATINRLSVKNREAPLPIQQEIKGSKPKTNAVTKKNVKFGEWNKELEAHIAGSAGYDVLIGVPTLTDGGAVIDVKGRKVHFRAWGYTMDCEVLKEAPKAPKPDWAMDGAEESCGRGKRVVYGEV
jgi:hypothetical protein